MPTPEEKFISYSTRTVGSLPLMRGLLKRSRIKEVIDRLCPVNDQALLSHGEVAEALVANRLSAPRPLYAVEEWAEQAGVEQVFGIRPKGLNDDRLGRTLDVLAAQAGGLKGAISLEVAREYGIGLSQLHFDLTTVYVEGEYGEEEADAIRIVYTKDKAREAAEKGFRIGVSTFEDGKGPVSLNYQALDGNTGTAEAALRNMEEIRKVLGQRKDRVLQVSDRAGVTAEVVAKAEGEGFHVVGPLTMNPALRGVVRDLVGGNPGWERMSYLSERQGRRPAEDQEGYRAFEVEWAFEHEGKAFPARLMVIHSDGKQQRDRKTREKRQEKIEKELERLRSRVGQPRWSMGKIRKGVEKALGRYQEGGFYEVVWEEAGGAPTGFHWGRREEAIEECRILEGIYAAATTLPKEGNGLDEVFGRMKHQYVVEDSHRILKGPLRVTPVFLQGPRRIEGLIFVLWLALVVYQVLQREFRGRAKDEEQKGWTTRVLLKILGLYAYVGIREGGEVRWVPSELTGVQQEIYEILGIALPRVCDDSS